MGKPSAGATDSASLATSGSFTATGQSTAILVRYDFNVTVWGTFVATIALERSFDGGTTWVNCSTDPSGTSNSITSPVSLVCREPESGVLYRLNCTAYTSGTANWRVSQ